MAESFPVFFFLKRFIYKGQCNHTTCTAVGVWSVRPTHVRGHDIMRLVASSLPRRLSPIDLSIMSRVVCQLLVNPLPACASRHSCMSYSTLVFVYSTRQSPALPVTSGNEWATGGRYQGWVLELLAPDTIIAAETQPLLFLRTFTTIYATKQNSLQQTTAL